MLFRFKVAPRLWHDKILESRPQFLQIHGIGVLPNIRNLQRVSDRAASVVGVEVSLVNARKFRNLIPDFFWRPRPHILDTKATPELSFRASHINVDISIFRFPRAIAA